MNVSTKANATIRRSHHKHRHNERQELIKPLPLTLLSCIFLYIPSCAAFISAALKLVTYPHLLHPTTYLRDGSRPFNRQDIAPLNRAPTTPRDNPQLQSLSNDAQRQGPFPMMPSQTFLNLANSQFELLANSLFHPSYDDTERKSKIKSIALYLPQENPTTGQLEFLPTVIYPCPSLERIFIASDADSGLAPLLPPTLTKLPGFQSAQNLLPNYPFASSSTDVGQGAGIGTPEEIMCDISSTDPTSGAAISLPLFSGQQTIGVMLVWPSSVDKNGSKVKHSGKVKSKPKRKKKRRGVSSIWTLEDKEQLSRAGETIALALCMDKERFQAQMQAEDVSVALADSLHQVKNPLQAMRTFAKLLQQDLAQERDSQSSSSKTEMLLSKMIDQGDRVADLLLPMDSILNILQEEVGHGISAESESVLFLPKPKERNEIVLREPESRNGNDPVHPHQFRNTTIMNASSKGKVKEEQVKSPRLSQSIETPMEMSFLTDVLGPTLSATTEVARERGIKFQVIGRDDEAELPGVSIHPLYLQEAVSNILYNAINYVKLKYAVLDENASSPEIRVSLIPNEEKLAPGVTILVEDNGPGIPREERDRVFQRGFRGKTTKDLTKGSGIGLAISKSLISQMGGILEIVDNKPGHLEGAVIRIVLFRQV